MNSQTTPATNSTTSQQRIQNALAKETARKSKQLAERLQAFQLWMSNQVLYATYAPWFQVNGTPAAFRLWLADQEMRAAQGLPTDPLYNQYLAFLSQYPN
jgi:hypothetical protein